MKYTITVTQEGEWFRAHALDNEKNEEVAIEAQDPNSVIKIMADAIADREIAVMKSVCPGWAERRSKIKAWAKQNAEKAKSR